MAKKAKRFRFRLVPSPAKAQAIALIEAGGGDISSMAVLHEVCLLLNAMRDEQCENVKAEFVRCDTSTTLDLELVWRICEERGLNLLPSP